jgi:hypothetical protein
MVTCKFSNIPCKLVDTPLDLEQAETLKIFADDQTKKSGKLTMFGGIMGLNES